MEYKKDMNLVEKYKKYRKIGEYSFSFAMINLLFFLGFMLYPSYFDQKHLVDNSLYTSIIWVFFYIIWVFSSSGNDCFGYIL
jgi:hypothetical protein